MRTAAAIFLSIVALGGAYAGSRTATPAERAACEQPLQRQIDAINAQMRAGYTNAQGEQLRARLRELEKRRANCRKTQ